jgi:hypothetical protein
MAAVVVPGPLRFSRHADGVVAVDPVGDERLGLVDGAAEVVGSNTGDNVGDREHQLPLVAVLDA